jgi:protein-disulfide isomerase
MLRASLISALLLAGACFAAPPAATAPQSKALGNPQAPVRIDLYSDYQCPACKWLHENTVKPLVQDYVNTGKIYLVMREYPLPMHAHAREAACYACAAEKIGKYQLVGDQLFRTQDEWEKDGNVSGAACSVLSAEEAGRLRALAISPEILSLVNDDIRSGQNEAVGGTPTMIITKLIRRFPVAGPVSYPVLRKFIDSLLP